MTDLILLLQADLDIQAAYGRYEDVQAGRGAVFMRQLDAALTLLRQHPEIAPPSRAGDQQFMKRLGCAGFRIGDFRFQISDARGGSRRLGGGF